MGSMECRAIHSWTFSGLVGAFLDLFIAYFLLCASTLAYFASKVLGFFGLCLPCPCNGLFGNPNKDYCLQGLLVEYPTRNISSIQLSVKSNFPFDSTWVKDQNDRSSFKVDDYENHDRHVELEGEASCSSVSGARKSLGSLDRESVPRNEATSKEGRFDLKGKDIMYQRPKSGLRRRRKGIADYRRILSASTYDSLKSDMRGVPKSSFSINKEVPAAFASNGDDLNDGEGALALERVPLDSSLYVTAKEKTMVEDASLLEELRGNIRGELGFTGNDENTIRLLELALEEEHVARATLHLELEKERNAAATAADEAMAMILRLQEEKASIEMQARQYQRMVEEKSAYDAEEMNILKEILVRREREKHVLEKEVEAYRQMVFEDEQLDEERHNFQDEPKPGVASSLYLEEDPVLLLQQISEFIKKKENINNGNKSSEFKVTSIESQSQASSFAIGLPILKCSDECNEGFQEKGTVFVNEIPFTQQIEVQTQETSLQSDISDNSRGINALEKTILSLEEQQEQRDETGLAKVMGTTIVKNHDEKEISIPCDGEDLKHGKGANQSNKVPCGAMHENVVHIHDVHVVDDESKFPSEIGEDGVKQLSVVATLNAPSKVNHFLEASEVKKVDVLGDFPTTSKLAVEPDVNRSKLAMTSRLPPIGTSRGKTYMYGMRRNSMSAVDYERVKLDSEVERLREKLKVVQEGREKLSFSVEHRERNQIQLQLLEDIASQLREIRNLTAAPGKAVRQTSLPLQSSKVMSKKRRCRSVSSGVYSST